MGGASGTLGPFRGTLAFGAHSAQLATVVLSTASAQSGRIVEVTVVRIRFA